MGLATQYLAEFDCKPIQSWLTFFFFKLKYMLL